MWRSIVVLLVVSSAILCVIADQQISIQLEHSFNGKDYSPKGTVTFRNPNSILNVDERKLQNSIKFTPASISDADLKQISLSNGLYYVRAMTDNGVVFSSAKMCAIIASNLVETVGLSIDSDGALLGIDYRPETYSCGSGKISAKQFKTEVDIGFPRAAAKVMSEYMPTRVQEEAKQPESQGSWISRYWYYIVPFVAISLIGQFLNPPAAAEGGGNGGQAARRNRA